MANNYFLISVIKLVLVLSISYSGFCRFSGNFRVSSLIILVQNTTIIYAQELCSNGWRAWKQLETVQIQSTNTVSINVIHTFCLISVVFAVLPSSFFSSFYCSTLKILQTMNAIEWKENNRWRENHWICLNDYLEVDPVIQQHMDASFE